MSDAPNVSDRGREYLIRAAGLEGYVPLVRELGLDAEQLLSKAGIDPASLADPDNMLSYRAFLRALDVACRESGLPNFGLLLAERQPLSMLGPLGFAIREAPDIRSALEEIISYLHLHTQGAGVKLFVEGGIAMLRFEVHCADAPGIELQEDLATAIGAGILRSFLGQSWSPDRVTLERQAPLDTTPYHKLFRCPVFFEAEHNQIVLDAALLGRPLASSNRQLFDILNDHLSQLDASVREDFRTEVQQLILQALKSESCSLSRVASYLAMTPRTLQRRLAAAGTSFQGELDEVRNRVAIRYLEQTQMPLTNVSAIIGYADLAAFSRAFRRRNGVSPSGWRQKHQPRC